MASSSRMTPAERLHRLFVAVHHHDLPTLRSLLAEGADPNQLCAGGWNAVHLGATNRQALGMLLAHGGNVNLATTMNGDTALHLAAARGKTDCVRLCLEYGANYRALGCTPLDVVKRSNWLARKLVPKDSLWYLTRLAQLDRDQQMHEMTARQHHAATARASARVAPHPTDPTQDTAGSGHHSARTQAQSPPPPLRPRRPAVSSPQGDDVSVFGFPSSTSVTSAMAGDQGSWAEQIARILECGICLSTMTDAVTLPCGHSFCAGCLRGLIAHAPTNAFACPMDRYRFPINFPLRPTLLLQQIVGCVKIHASRRRLPPPREEDEGEGEALDEEDENEEVAVEAEEDNDEDDEGLEGAGRAPAVRAAAL